MMQIVKTASQYPVIRDFTTQTTDSIINLHNGREVEFGNTNRLVSRISWPITLSKTGYTSKAGNYLVMQTQINARPVIIVLLESWGKLSKYGDSNRIKQWLIKAELLVKKDISKRIGLTSNISVQTAPVDYVPVNQTSVFIQKMKPLSAKFDSYLTKKVIVHNM